MRTSMDPGPSEHVCNDLDVCRELLLGIRSVFFLRASICVDGRRLQSITSLHDACRSTELQGPKINIRILSLHHEPQIFYLESDTLVALL